MIIKFNKKIVSVITFILFIVGFIVILQVLKPSYVDESNYRWIVIGRFVVINIFTVVATIFSYRYVKKRKYKSKKALFNKIFSIIIGIFITLIFILYTTSLYINLIRHGFDLQETKTMCSTRKSHTRRGGYSYYLKVKTKTGTLEELSITRGLYEWFQVNYPNLRDCKSIPFVIKYEQVFYNVVW